MLRVRLLTEEEFFDHNIPIDPYEQKSFFRLLGGLGHPQAPPFRDRESLKFIREVDQGELIEGDWYSYLSPYGRTSMCYLCGGTQYALTCIDNSRRGIYTRRRNYGKDIFARLGEIEQDILIACPVWEEQGDISCMLRVFPPCIIENYRHNGQEQEVLYDPSASPPVLDFKEYRYIWQEDLPNLLQKLKHRLDRAALTWSFPPAEVSPEQIAAVCPDWDVSGDMFPRRLLFCMHECPRNSMDKYPRILYIRHFRGGTYSFEEHCPVKYPDFSDILWDVAQLYDPACEEAFAAVFDVGCFHSPSDFGEKLLWEFHDNGRELTCYSGTLGEKKLLEFWEQGLEHNREYV